jgi:phosphocarrier protein
MDVKRNTHRCGVRSLTVLNTAENNNQCNFAEREVVIGNKMGLHSRPAAEIVKMLSGFQGEVSLSRTGEGGESADCHSILSMLILAAGRGTRLMLRVSGDGACGVIEKVGDFFDRNFDEESE